MSGGCVCLPALRFHYVQLAGGVYVTDLYRVDLLLGERKGVSCAHWMPICSFVVVCWCWCWWCYWGLLVFMYIQGLFRIAAGASKLKKLKAALDCSTSQLEEFYSDPHAVAGTSKPKAVFNVSVTWTNSLIFVVIYAKTNTVVLHKAVKVCLNQTPKFHQARIHHVCVWHYTQSMFQTPRAPPWSVS